MTNRFLLARTTLAAVALLAPVIVRAADSPAVSLKKGDRIVFLGDSITQGGGGPQGYVTLIKKAFGREAQGPWHRGHRRRHQRQQGARPAAPLSTRDVHRQEADASWSSTSASTTSGTARTIRPSGTSKEKFEAGLKEVIGKIKTAGAGDPLHAERHRREEGRRATSSTPSSTSTPTSAARWPRR